MAKPTWGVRAVVLAASGALVLAACGGGDDDGGESSGSGNEEGQQGGTLYYLDTSEQVQHLDPQRNYTGEDLAFANSFLHRSLTTYKFSPDPEEANELVADLATDTGTPNDDATEWQFTIRYQF